MSQVNAPCEPGFDPALGTVCDPCRCTEQNLWTPATCDRCGRLVDAEDLPVHRERCAGPDRGRGALLDEVVAERFGTRRRGSRGSR